MIMTDIHNHSHFSSDGKSTLSDMVNTAKSKGLRYYGVADHFNYDFRYEHTLIWGKEIVDIDTDRYFAEARALQSQVSDEHFTLLVGAEVGYTAIKDAHAECAEMIEKYHPDFIVNSIHLCHGFDAYRGSFFEGKDKISAYREYLDCVRESLDVPYKYDIVAHLAYVSRNAPYENKKFVYEEFADEVDDILKTIIQKGVILEVNSSAHGAGSEFLPDTDVLTRYYQLGGRMVSFASDAHYTQRVADKYELVCDALKQIGFEYITVPDKGEYIKVLI